MSHRGLYVEKIAAFFNWNIQTVRDTLHRWQQQGLGGLWDAPRPGPRPRWQPEDIEYLETCLREDPRTYNGQQLANKLESERNVKLSADRPADLILRPDKHSSQMAECSLIVQRAAVVMMEALAGVSKTRSAFSEHEFQ
jgi:transposase